MVYYRFFAIKLMSCVLVDGRWLKLPKYLIKEKIQHVRKKILARKYGYLWYRITLSKILPSVAVKYYTIKIKHRGYMLLKQNWYDQKVLWRLILRAELHYVYILKRNMFHKWLNVILERKQLRLKLRIAEVFYNKTIIARYFLRLKNIKRIEQVMTSYGITSKTYLVYLYLNFNALMLFHRHAKAFQEYCMKVLFEINYKNKHLKYYFEKLRVFTAHMKYRRYRALKAEQFFLRHYKIQYLLKYFNIWKEYIKNKHAKKAAYMKSENNYKNRIMQHAFKKLYKYSKYRQFKTTLKIGADMFYSMGLKKRTLNLWKLYAERKLNKKNRLNSVSEYYLYKIKKSCFLKLLKNKNYQFWLRDKLCAFKEGSEYRAKYVCIVRLKKYVTYKKTKSEKYISVANYYKHKLAYRCLRTLESYNEYKKCKRKRRDSLLIHVFENQNKKLLKICFLKWKAYLLLKNQKKQEIEIVKMQYKNCLLRRIIRKWFQYKCIKNNSRKMKHNAENYYRNKLTRNALHQWHYYTQKQKRFGTTLEIARKMYEKSLLQRALATVLTHGLRKQQNRNEMAFQNLLKSFQIGLKYFKIWKYKVLHKTLKENHVNILRINEAFGISSPTFPNKVNIDLVTFKWNPLCFMKPRIPQFLKSTLQ